MRKDLYKILNINKEASPEEIKKSYRKLAKKYHPDFNKGDKKAEAQFKEINEAYETLKDPSKKSQYDSVGQSNFWNTTSSGFSDGVPPGFDIFDNISKRMNPNRPRQGRRIEETIYISLEDALYGSQKTINVKRLEKCETCDGSGHTDNSVSTCKLCNGTGTIRNKSFNMVIQRTCNSCNGTGKTYTNPCPSCLTRGYVRKDSKLIINIPKGIKDNAILRVPGKGENSINDGPPGDLFITVKINKHEKFDVSGNNLIYNADLPFTTAILGGNITVPTLEGTEVRAKIKSGMQSGTVISLKGKGLPYNSTRGNLLVKLFIKIPFEISDSVKKLIEEVEVQLKKDENI